MKKIICFWVVLLALCTMSVRAEEWVSTATDQSGTFDVKMVFETSTSEYQVSIMKVNDSGWSSHMTIPAKIHAKFENYDGLGHDLEDDFEYEPPVALFNDDVARETVKKITFEEGVEVIADYFFDNADGFNYPSILETIEIPASAKKIGDYAFRGHIKLEKIDFAEGSKLTDIGQSAFEAVYEEGMEFERIYHSSIKTLNLPDGVELIGQQAFKGLVNLKSFTTPAMLMYVGAEAFDQCGIETLKWNSPILKATSSPFATCPLKKVVVLGEMKGDINIYSAHIPAHALENVHSAFELSFFPDPTNTSVSWEGIDFGPYSLKNSGLKSIKFPQAFVKGGDLLPDALNFDTASLQGTSSLTSIDLSIPSEKNIAIKPFAFAYSGIESVTFSDNVREIGDSAFYYAYKLQEVSIPLMYNYGGATKEPLYMEFGEGAFADTRSMKEASIKTAFQCKGIPGILPAFLFKGSYIERIELPAATPYISAYAFSETKLKEFDATSTVVNEIDQYAFADCKELEKVDLSTSKVKVIPRYAFNNDVKLKELKLPAEMDYIREYSLQGTALKSLDVDASHLDGYAIYDMPELESVRFVNKDLEFILEGVLCELPKLKSVDWGSKVKSLAAGAISNCPNYHHFVIGAGFEHIDKTALSDDQKALINQITLLSNKMEDIALEKEAPFRFMNIDTLIIDKAVTNIPKNLFNGLTIQKNVELRKDLTIHEDAFNGANLVNVNWHYSDIATFPIKKASISDLSFSGVDAIPDGLFAGISPIEYIILDGIKTIGKQAFKNVKSDDVTIPASVTEIKDEAFDDADIDNIVFEKGTSLKIGTKAFHRTSGTGTYTRITSYWPADNIPAAAGAFDCDEIDEFVAINAAARDAYKAADGWKDLQVKNWVGLTEFKYSFEIVGETSPRPIEYYSDAILINDMKLNEAYIDNTNKAKLRFVSPCSGITFDHWADGTKDADECNIELKSDTVIKIYVKEEREDVKLSAKNRSNGATYGDAVKIYMATAEDPENWVEMSEAKVNECSWVKAKVVLTDPDHYWFNGWFDTSDKLETDQMETARLEKATTLIADVRKNIYSVSIQAPSACMDCDEKIDYFVVNDANVGSSYDQAVEYGTELTVKVVGKKGSNWRYVLDYWEDELGEKVSIFSPYTFTVTDNVMLYSHMTFANKYHVTVSSNDESFGTATMSYNPDDLVETGVFWEGAILELKAQVVYEHAVFNGWNDGGKDLIHNVKVTKDFNYIAAFDLKTFKVTFVDWDDSVLDEQYVIYGGSAIAPINPTREGYTFIDWDKEFNNITADLTVKALYEEIPEGLDNTDAAAQPRKELRNGQILIFHGDRVYDVIGNRIR